MSAWNPDHDFIDFVGEKTKGDWKNTRVQVGQKILDHAGLMQEMRKGTNFGRRVYKMMFRNAQNQAEYRNWQAGRKKP